MGTYVMNYRVCPGSFFPGPRCQTYSSARIRSVNASQHESFHTSTHLKVFSPTLNFQQGTCFWFFVLLLACQFVDSLFYSDMFGTAPVTGLCAPCSTFFFQDQHFESNDASTHNRREGSPRETAKENELVSFAFITMLRLVTQPVLRIVGRGRRPKEAQCL